MVRKIILVIAEIKLVFMAFLPKDSSCVVSEIWFVVNERSGKTQGICFILMSAGNPVYLPGTEIF